MAKFVYTVLSILYLAVPAPAPVVPVPVPVPAISTAMSGVATTAYYYY